ncbi:MAG: DUF1499 domain-containing protein [Granulosicoccus sp.]
MSIHLWLIALIIVIILLVLRLAMPRLTSSVASGPIENNGVQALSDCPDSPNCQSSASSRQEQSVAPLSISGNPSLVMATVAEFINSESNANVVQQQGYYLHATYKTRLMGYIDDVEFLLDASTKQLHIRSASRVGRKDFGANAKRIELIRAALAGEI